MKLDRNDPANKGGGKYALINMREIRNIGGVGENPDIAAALDLLEINGLIQYGPVGTKDEFFVVKLKDKYSLPALEAYAKAVGETDPQFAVEVLRMAERAGPLSEFCKLPD